MIILDRKLTLLKFQPVKTGEKNGKAWKMSSGKVVDDEGHVLSVNLGKKILENEKELELTLSLQNVSIVAKLNVLPKGQFDCSITVEDFEVVDK